MLNGTMDLRLSATLVVGRRFAVSFDTFFSASNLLNRCEMSAKHMFPFVLYSNAKALEYFSV